jgi:hypothetical protein
MTANGQSASQSWCQAPPGAQDKIYVIVSHSIIDAKHPLWQEDSSVIYRGHSQ